MNAMHPSDRHIERTLATLRERAKELDCLYAVDEILSRPELPPEKVLPRLLDVIPAGFQYPEVCRCRIVIGGQAYEPVSYTHLTLPTN